MGERRSAVVEQHRVLALAVLNDDSTNNLCSSFRARRRQCWRLDERRFAGEGSDEEEVGRQWAKIVCSRGRDEAESDRGRARNPVAISTKFTASSFLLSSVAASSLQSRSEQSCRGAQAALRFADYWITGTFSCLLLSVFGCVCLSDSIHIVSQKNS